MRIIAYVNGNSGPSYHRCIVPLMLMKDVDVYVTNDLKVEDFEKGVDLFMYNRILPDHALPIIKELQSRYEFKICVDLDDFWQLDEHHILYEEYQRTEFAKKQIQQIKEADVVLVTHSRLAEEAAVYNPNVHVCPNAIPKQGQFDIEREPYYLTRLFWQGSDTHRADIALLKTPIDKLGPIAGKIKMIMAGYAEDHEDWYNMVMDYTAQAKHQYKLIPATKVTEYYAAYAHADICLVPLINSKFNRHKSNLKILEAANLGLPVIASEVHPYLDMPVFYAKHANDWVKYIKRLVESRKRQKEAGQQLAEYCAEHYPFEKINNARRQILEYEASTDKRIRAATS
jgi:glycosyltransferase involved in cell wall biosynthesis